MNAKYKVPVVIGGTVLLAACGQPPRVYYQSPYQPPPQVYYAPTYAARPVPRPYAPPPEIVPAKPEPPKTETARRETTPPRVPSPPSADDCVGWWRICHFL